LAESQCTCVKCAVITWEQEHGKNGLREPCRREGREEGEVLIQSTIRDEEEEEDRGMGDK